MQEREREGETERRKGSIELSLLFQRLIPEIEQFSLPSQTRVMLAVDRLIDVLGITCRQRRIDLTTIG